MGASCPHCNFPLSPQVIYDLPTRSCLLCKKSLITESAFHELVGDEQGGNALNSILESLKKAPPGKTPCPLCNGPMKATRLFLPKRGFNVDFCPHCAHFWLAFANLDAAPKGFARKLPKLALMGDEMADTTVNDFVTNSFFVETRLPQIDDPNSFPRAKIAHVALGFTALAFVVTSAGFKRPGFFEKFAFFPTDPGREHGITLLSYSLLHANPGHFFGNMYFFWLFASAVEHVLGSEDLICLIAISSVTSALVHGFFNPRPVIGASGVVAALTFFFICQYPGVKLKEVFLSQFSRGMITFRIPAWAWGSTWLLTQYVGLYNSHSRVSSGGHIGGALTGILFWFTRKSIASRGSAAK